MIFRSDEVFGKNPGVNESPSVAVVIREHARRSSIQKQFPWRTNFLQAKLQSFLKYIETTDSKLSHHVWLRADSENSK